MKSLRLVNADRGTTLGTSVGLADGWWTRFRGLSGRDGLKCGEGLLLRPCRAVHMLGMRFPLDVVFTGADGRVVAVYENLQPNKRTKYHRAARDAIELPVGTVAATQTLAGDRLICHEE